MKRQREKITWKDNDKRLHGKIETKDYMKRQREKITWKD